MMRVNPPSLEVEEDTGASSQAVICRFLMLFEIEVESPSGTDPLPPRGNYIVDRKVEQHVVRRGCEGGATDHLVTLPTPFVTKRDVVFFVVALCRSNILSAGKNIAGASVRPREPSLEHDRILEVVSRPYLSPNVLINCLALIETKSGRRDQLAALKQLSIHESVNSVSG